MNPQRSTTVQSGDVRIAVQEYGIDHPATLVLVHGYPDSSEVWRHMIAPLSRRFRVVTYDVRGCGQSTEPASRKDYSLEWLSRDFRAVIDAVSPDQPVHLLAHDWGGIQSWESVTEPDLQRRILSYTCISGPSLDHIGHWMRRDLVSLSPVGWVSLGGQFLHSWYVFLFHLPVIAPTLWKLALGRRWHRMLASTQGIETMPSATQLKDGVNGIQLYRANIRRVARPRDRHTRVPVQLIVPLDDDFVRPVMALESARPWVEKLWCREIDAGHWAPLSHGGLLASMALEFIDLVEGRRASPALEQARVGSGVLHAGQQVSGHVVAP